MSYSSRSALRSLFEYKIGNTLMYRECCIRDCLTTWRNDKFTSSCEACHNALYYDSPTSIWRVCVFREFQGLLK